MSGEIPEARRRYLAACIHRLGPGPISYLIKDLEAGGELWATLETYARLPAELVHAYHGDQPPRPIVVLPGGRL
jgi:hypothetical protein